MQGQNIPCFLISELIYLSETVPRQTQEPAELFQANVVFGRASRGLDHAAIQGVSKDQLHEPQGGRGKRVRAQERDKTKKETRETQENISNMQRSRPAISSKLSKNYPTHAPHI